MIMGLDVYGCARLLKDHCSFNLYSVPVYSMRRKLQNTFNFTGWQAR